jgi:hypothetical protein
MIQMASAAGLLPPGAIPYPPTSSAAAGIPMPSGGPQQPPLPPQAAFAAYQGMDSKEGIKEAVDGLEQKPDITGQSTSKMMSGKTRIVVPDELISLVNFLTHLFLLFSLSGRTDGHSGCSTISSWSGRPFSSLTTEEFSIKNYQKK